MANINKNKSENDLKKVISDVAKEEIEMKSKKSTSKSDKKSANKSVKKIVKKVTKKTTKKEIEKKTKKKETNGLDLIKPIVVGGRSRKKKENIDNIFDENLKPIVEDKKKSDINEIKNEDLVINDEKELFKDDNINNSKTEKNEVKNDDNNGLSIKNLNNKVVNTNDIDDDEIFKDDDDKIERVEKKKMESPKEKKQISKVVVVGIVVVAILFFAIFIATKTMKTVIPNVTAVNNITDLNKKLDASLVPPKEIKNIQYGIEGDGVARMDYARKSDNGTMNLIFKMSKDPDKDLYSESHNWGERIIYINVACDDGTVINVESYEALDDVTALIALWKDNNEYYSLFTKDVSTKEDFYREVNQIVATNHKV